MVRNKSTKIKTEVITKDGRMITHSSTGRRTGKSFLPRKKLGKIRIFLPPKLNYLGKIKFPRTLTVASPRREPGRALIKVRAWRLVIVRAAVVFLLAVSVMVTIARDNSSLFGLTLLQEGY